MPPLAFYCLILSLILSLFQRRINTKIFLEEKFKMGNNSSRCYDPKDLPSMYRNVLSDVTCIRENSKEFDQSCKMDCENCDNCELRLRRFSKGIAISQITQLNFLEGRNCENCENEEIEEFGSRFRKYLGA